MARFALRNQEKIKSAFGAERLKELLEVLRDCFAQSVDEIRGKVKDDKPYPSLDVGIATIYVTRIYYDVYHVALKNFNNKT